MANARQTGQLNGLIVHCRDDVRTYREAAASRGKHRGELLALSRRRSSFAEALSRLVRGAGSAPRRHGSLSGWIRRAFFGARVAVLGENHLGDSLHACAQQESRTADAYRRVLQLQSGDVKWPAEVEAILRSQLGEIHDAHTRVRLLRGNA
jgi:uncharacterized protein (TIGR02284 family)